MFRDALRYEEKRVAEVMALPVISAVLSAIVDNIPYVATTSPIVGDVVVAGSSIALATPCLWLWYFVFA